MQQIISIWLNEQQKTDSEVVTFRQILGYITAANQEFRRGKGGAQCKASYNVHALIITGNIEYIIAYKAQRYKGMPNQKFNHEIN